MAALTACPGACNAAYRGGQGEPRPGEPVWCGMDGVIIGRKLVQLDDLAAMREYQVTGFHEQGRAPARGGNAPSPSPAMDDLLDLDKMLTGWEAAYRDWHNDRHPERPWLTIPYRGVLCTVRHGTVCWLSQNLSGILASDMAVPFGEEIIQFHREFMAKTRAGDGRRLAFLPCPRPDCQLRTLAWVDGDRGLICGHCNRYVTRAEYDEMAGRELERAG